MITILVSDYNTISKKTYDDMIDSLEFTALTCSCGHSGCLTKHGGYLRSVKTTGETIQLFIKRVRCSICKLTHALIPSYIVPYSQTPLKEQTCIIAGHHDKKVLNMLMESCPGIDESTIASIVRRYRKSWEQRLLTFSIKLSPINDLVTQCFGAFASQFMQIKSTPNILFSKPT